MRRQVVDTLAAKLTARGLDPVRTWAGGRKGYVLVLGPVTVATKTKAEALLRGARNGRKALVD